MSIFEEISSLLSEHVRGGNISLFGLDMDPNGIVDCKQRCTKVGCSEVVVGTVKGEVDGKDYPEPPIPGCPNATIKG